MTCKRETSTRWLMVPGWMDPKFTFNRREYIPFECHSSLPHSPSSSSRVLHFTKCKGVDANLISCWFLSPRRKHTTWGRKSRRTDRRCPGSYQMSLWKRWVIEEGQSIKWSGSPKEESTTTTLCSLLFSSSWCHNWFITVTWNEKLSTPFVSTELLFYSSSLAVL